MNFSDIAKDLFPTSAAMQERVVQILEEVKREALESTVPDIKEYAEWWATTKGANQNDVYKWFRANMKPAPKPLERLSHKELEKLVSNYHMDDQPPDEEFVSGMDEIKLAFYHGLRASEDRLGLSIGKLFKAIDSLTTRRERK